MLREGVNDFAGPREVHLLARISFNRVRVGLEPLHVFLKLMVLLLELLNPLLDRLHLAPLVAERQPAMVSENFVNGEGHEDQQQRQQQTAAQGVDRRLRSVKFSNVLLPLQRFSL